MRITCPNCQTRYALTEQQLGAGRNVSCSNCGQVWFADPVSAEPDPAALPPRRAALQQPPPRYGAPPGYPPPYPPQAAAYAGAPGYPPPQPGAYPGYPPPPNPAQTAVPVPPPPAPPPPAPPPPAPPPPAPPPAAVPETPDKPEPAPIQEPADELISTDDLDAMFDDDDEGPAFDSFVDIDEKNSDDAEIEDPDEMEEPDDIPDMFTPDDQEPDDETPRKRGWIKLVFVLLLVLIFGSVGAFFFARGVLIEMHPPLKDIYESIGLVELGEGLQIQQPEFEQEVEGGLEVLIVKALITNVSDKTREVPLIRATLLDQEFNVLSTTDMAPLKSELEKGESISAKIRIKEPSPLRRRVTVTFVEAAESGAGQ